MSLIDQKKQTAQVCPHCKIMLPFNQVACYNCGFQLAAMQTGNASRDTQALPFAGRGQPSSLGISQLARGETPALGMPQAREGEALSSVKPRLTSSARIEKDQPPLQKRATLVYLMTVVLVIVIVAFAGLHAAGISLSTLTLHASKTSGTAYPLPKVAPLFTDSFVNDASGWNLQSSPGNYQVTVGNGMLTLNVNKNKLLWEPLTGTISYSYFKLSINPLLAKGDQNNGYGLYIRGAPDRTSDLATYYRFELYGDASYAIFKGTVDQNGISTATKIVNYTLSSAIQKQGKVNNIMLLASGTSLSFIVNGQLLKTFTDASYTAGSIALFASNLPGAKPGIQVRFSQLALYPIHMVQSS